jgi:methylated-DNA-protein-cysteine methyltransferase related protein
LGIKRQYFNYNLNFAKKNMPPKETSYFDMVYDVTRMIPSGRVTSYGAIANYLALGSARMVGWALNALNKNHDVPAHRVVNRLGELSGRIMFPTPTTMQERLESEGIEIKDDKVVNFKTLFWNPTEIENL